MCFSCRFLPIKEVNQKLPQMKFFDSKLNIFARKKIYDADTKSLIFQGYVVTRCPILRYDVLQQTILTITYSRHHLLSNGGNLFTLLCKYWCLFAHIEIFCISIPLFDTLYLITAIYIYTNFWRSIMSDHINQHRHETTNTSKFRYHKIARGMARQCW